MHSRGAAHGLDIHTLPNRVFLDTSVVNKIVEFGAYLFDNYLGDEEQEEYYRRPGEDQEDIESLHDIFLVAQRLCLPLYISEYTVHELSRTPIGAKRRRLLEYSLEVFDHWLQSGDSEVKAAYLRRKGSRFVNGSTPGLGFIPDEGDRLLLSDAMSMGCDVFLTMDRKSIWEYRERIQETGIRVLRPCELWEMFRPWAPLWY